MEEWNAICDDLATRYPIVFGHYDVQDSNIIIDTKTGQMLTNMICCISYFYLCGSDTKDGYFVK